MESWLNNCGKWMYNASSITGLEELQTMINSDFWHKRGMETIEGTIISFVKGKTKLNNAVGIIETPKEIPQWSYDYVGLLLFMKE